MRNRLIVAAVLVLAAAGAAAGERGSRTLSGWLNVTTPDGWTGQRYMDGNDIFAEEFDSDGDSRIDVWRFYRGGILSSEERDLNADDKVDFQSRWDSRSRRLRFVLRDTGFHGVNDLEIEAGTGGRWEIREDRNRDGVTDRILIVNGPPDLFDVLQMDLARQENVIDNIPAEYWRELRSDDTFATVITDYRRYLRGTMTHYGEWDGRRVAWRRVGPDFEPPPPAVRTAQVTEPAAPPAVPPAAQTGPYPAGTPAGITGMEPTGQFLADDPAFAAPVPGIGAGPSLRDRTRYEGLPPGESAARSVPARMRPPGVGRR